MAAILAKKLGMTQRFLDGLDSSEKTIVIGCIEALHKLPGDKTAYDAFEWENKFQLTEPNQYFVDVGLITEIEIPREHRIGPAIFGKVKLQGREAIRYNAALLFGETNAAPRQTFRLQAEYEF